MLLSFSVLGTGHRLGEHLVSFDLNILWHFCASAPLKGFVNIEPHKENSSRKQVDAHHKETLQRSNTMLCGDRCVCKLFSPEGSFNTRGHTECSDASSEECCEWKTYHLYMLLGSSMWQRMLKWMGRGSFPKTSCRVLHLHGILGFVHCCVRERIHGFEFCLECWKSLLSEAWFDLCSHQPVPINWNIANTSWHWPQIRCKGGVCRGMGNELFSSSTMFMTRWARWKHGYTMLLSLQETHSLNF